MERLFFILNFLYCLFHPTAKQHTFTITPRITMSEHPHSLPANETRPADSFHPLPDITELQQPAPLQKLPAAAASATKEHSSGADPAVKIPRALQFICGICLALMANQIRFPVNAEGAVGNILSKIGVSEIAFVIAFISFLVFFFCKKRCTIHLPVLCLLPVIGMALANIFSRTGMGGMVDTAQMAMILVGGVSLFAFMHRYMPKTALLAVSAGLLLNLVAALIQCLRFGAFLSLAPKDIIELQYGIGNAMTGLFRSRIAYSLFVTASLAWCFPQWLSLRFWPRASFFRSLLWGILTALCLVLIPYAPFALLAAVLVLAIGFYDGFHGATVSIFALCLAAIVARDVPKLQILDAWKDTISPLKGYDYVPDASILFNRPTPLLGESASPTAHELKTSHYDAVAAVRLALTDPWHGVGSGNYQKHINNAYTIDEDARCAQLPKPTLNDVPTDSQSGWGILLATLGFPAAIAFALCFFAALGGNLRRVCEDIEDCRPLHLAAAATICVFILAMFLSNPLTKGLGWTLALAIAAAETSPADRKYPFFTAFNTFNTTKLLGFFAVAALFTGSVLLGAKAAEPAAKQTPALAASQPAAVIEQPAVEQPAATPAAAEQPAALAAAEQPAAEKDATEQPAAAAEKTDGNPVPPPPATTDHILKADEGDELFLVFNADHAIQITKPMRLEEDKEGTFAKGILNIPDKEGVPPAGKNPALQYGGCVFECELPQDANAYLWFNVVWDGSCGNTLDVAIDDAPTSITVGNDGTYNAWHWVKPKVTFKLKAGRHKINVLNREDGIKLGQVLMTNDKDYIPEGVEEK